MYFTIHLGCPAKWVWGNMRKQFIEMVLVLGILVLSMIPSLSCNATSLPIITTKGAWKIINDMPIYRLNGDLQYNGDGTMAGEAVQYYSILDKEQGILASFTCSTEGYPVMIAVLVPKSYYNQGIYGYSLLAGAVDIPYNPNNAGFNDAIWKGMSDAMERGNTKLITIPGSYRQFIARGYDASRIGFDAYNCLEIYCN